MGMEDINVRQIRKVLGYTQNGFADAMGVSPRTLWAWEHGTQVPKSKIRIMLDMLKQAGYDVQAYERQLSIANDVEEPANNVGIPLLPVNAIGGYVNDDDVSIMEYECERIMSPIRGAELAVRVSGDSMYPRYPNGSMVFIRKHDPNIFIEWGSYYVVNTTNGTIIKRITDGDDNTITCSSVNPNFKDFKVARSEIRAMYKILGCFNPE